MSALGQERPTRVPDAHQSERGSGENPRRQILQGVLELLPGNGGSRRNEAWCSGLPPLGPSPILVREPLEANMSSMRGGGALSSPVNPPRFSGRRSSARRDSPEVIGPNHAHPQIRWIATKDQQEASRIEFESSLNSNPSDSRFGTLEGSKPGQGIELPQVKCLDSHFNVFQKASSEFMECRPL